MSRSHTKGNEDDEREGNRRKPSGRTTAILVRVTAGEKRRLKRASQRDGLGLSTMLRALGLEHARDHETR